MPTRRKTKGRRMTPRRRGQRRDLSPSRGLGVQLLDTIENIVELMEHTQDPDRLKELNKQRIALSNEARRLIDVSLNTASVEYRGAATALEQASSTIREAIKGLESIKTAILKAARALELVAKIAAMA